MRPSSGQVNRPVWGDWLTAGCTILLMVFCRPAWAIDIAPADPIQTLDNGRLIVLSALACGAVALAIAASLWALAEQGNARRLRRALNGNGARVKAALG